MKKTENFQLNQWESTDRIMMEDFNGDNAKIDAALGTLSAASESQAATLAQHTAAMAKLGNCQIYVTSYVGDGSGNPGKTLTFPTASLLVMITPDSGITDSTYAALYVKNGVMTKFSYNTQKISTEITNGGKTIRWYNSNLTGNGDDFLNKNGNTYHVVAFLAADGT